MAFSEKLYKEYFKINNIVQNDNIDILNGNANIDGKSPWGKMSLMGTEASKEFALKELIKPEIAKEHGKAIYIHDLDFYATGTITCVQLPIDELFETGFDSGRGWIRPPKSISTACMLTALLIEEQENFMHGGISVPCIDLQLEKYVKISYDRNKKEIEDLLDYVGTKDGVYLEKLVEEKAWAKTVRETEQAMQGLVFNISTLSSRGSSQSPFASINFGIGTSKEARLISFSLLKAQEEGLGKGETLIFPILCFQTKAGVNLNPCDPNYDLFKRGIEVFSKRLFPNWVNLDAKENIRFYEAAMAVKDNQERVYENNFEYVETEHGKTNVTGIKQDKWFKLLPATMGCVDGDQTITYRIKQRNGEYFYYENVPIKEAFKHITKIERNK